MPGQFARWCFTLNNYREDLDYSAVFNHGHVKRCVWGREVGENGTRHLQGYLEFKRSHRLNRCKLLLDRAHWEAAKGTAKQNYDYCVKDGEFNTFGDWDSVLNRRLQLEQKRDKVKSLLRGICEGSDPDLKYSGLYIHHKRAIDESVAEFKQLTELGRRYKQFSTALLSRWQMSVVRQAFTQTDRSILWVYDERGARGKTFLGHFLQAMYGFDLLDGITKATDVCWLLCESVKGIVFDVTRSSKDHFCYNTLESVKNGYIMSGKYKGYKRMFKPVPVIVFANFEPDYTRLSADRWNVVCLDNALPHEEAPALRAQEEYPFQEDPTPSLPKEDEEEAEVPPNEAQVAGVPAPGNVPGREVDRPGAGNSSQ